MFSCRLSLKQGTWAFGAWLLSQLLIGNVFALESNIPSAAGNSLLSAGGGPNPAAALPGLAGQPNAAGTTLAAAANTSTAVFIGPVLGAPKHLMAKPGGEKILLAWEPVAGLAGRKISYQVFRSEENLIATESDQWPEPINLEPVQTEYFLDVAGNSRLAPVPGKTYYYAVAALDTLGNKSQVSAPLLVANISELSPPTGFEAKAGDKSVSLSWAPSFSEGARGLAGYVLYRSTQAEQPGEALFAQPMQIVEYQDKGTAAKPLANGVTYYYTLFAQDQAGLRSLPAGPVAAIPYLPASAPQNVTSTGKSDDVIEVQWSVSEAGSNTLAGYNIYRKSDQETDFVKINKDICSTNTFLDSESGSLSKPLLGRFYTYTVRAVDSKGLESQDSAPTQSGPRLPLEIPRSGLLSTTIPGLPPESSLTISGRKKINVSYTMVQALNVPPLATSDRFPSITSGLIKGFNLAQELQVRLEGKVGRKITVDVDYDDTLQNQDQQKISIIYAGDPDEVIQEAAFGDILLDLPRTEFAGYNKNLFGASLKVALGDFSFKAIGAQTKGITVTENFTGNTSRRTLNKDDTAFIAFKYYYLTKDWPNQVNHPDLPGYNAGLARHGIVPGSEKIYVTNNNITIDTVTVTMSAQAQTLRFNKLAAGVDYSVDYERGIITFMSGIQPTWLISAAYQYYDSAGAVHAVGFMADGKTPDFTPANLQVPADGKTRDSAHLLQNYNSTTNAKDYSMMLMNCYSLGYQNIMDPQSDHDFVLKIYYANGQEYAPQVPQPTDTQNSEHYYRIDPNFGIIQFRHSYPFQQRGGSEPPQFLSDTYSDNRLDAYNTIYNPNLTPGVDGTSAHQFGIHVEFKNLVATFQLAHLSIIKNSEILRRDGAKLQRNTDYYIDYDIGLITFTNPESIAASTNITVTYEYLPFGGKYQSTLFGARAQYDLFHKKLSIGSTFLYNASQAPQDIPDIRSTPNALSLLDGDMKLSMNPSDFGDWSLPLLGTFNVPITMDVAAETAYSTFQTNSYRMAGEDGVAMIDSMEGSDNVLSLPTDNNAWFPSSRPAIFTDFNSRRYIALEDSFETGHNPVDANDKLHQLRWNYSNLTSDSWDGFVFPISTTGSNMHQYRNIEMWVKVPPNPTAPHMVLRFDLGVVSEDSNGNGVLNFEGDDKTLSTGADVGITNYFVDPYSVPPKIGTDPNGPQGVYPKNYPTGYWGFNNLRLNTEDLDGNGQLDQGESYYEYEVVLDNGKFDTGGWQLISIPLSKFTRVGGTNIPSTNPQDPNFLGFIKHMRVWATTDSTAPSAGYFQFENLQVTGNKWQPVGLDYNENPTIEPSANTINATTISLSTDSGYQPNTNFYIYDQTDTNTMKEELKNEKSLKLEYNLDRFATVAPGNTMPAFYVVRTMSTSSLGYDYSGYRYLRVDVFKRTPSNPGEKLFIRLSLDAHDYYQYELELDEAPFRSWHTYRVELDGSDGKRFSHFASGMLTGLTRINEVAIGVINPGANLTTTLKEIWVNNLRVTGAPTKQGAAYRVSTNTRYSDAFSVATDWRDVGSDFYMIDENPQGKQHATSSSVRGSLTKLPFLPINLSWNRVATYTEDKYRDNPSYSNTYTLPDVVTETQAGDIAFNQVPGLDLSVSGSRSRKTTEYLKFLGNVDAVEEISKGTPRLSYSLPSQFFNVPIGTTTLSGKLDYTDMHTKYDQDQLALSLRTDLWDRWQQTREETYTYDGSYSPIEYLRVSPGFTYSQTSDRGFLSWYRFYAALDATYNPDNKHYFSDLYRTSKINKIAKVTVNLQNLPVISPSVTYTMNNQRDYISDTLSLPGTLSLQSGVDFGGLLGWQRFPRFNLTQSYTTSATYKNELDKDPISKLDFQHLWIIDPRVFKQQDDLFNQAFINSKNFNESANTSLNLLANVNLTPQYSDSWARQMTSQNNFQTTKTMSLGSGLVWSGVPSLEWLVIQSMNLDYRYTQNSTLDTTDREITHNTTHTTTLTVPFRMLKDLTNTLTLGSTNTIRLSGNLLDVEIFENTYTGGLSVSYNLHMDSPVHLPNFWPFNGAVLKLQQTLRLTNAFNVEMVRNDEVGISGNRKSTNTYTNDSTVNYSLWKNVEGDITVTNQWFLVDHDIDANKDYWAIRLKAGLTAVF